MTEQEMLKLLLQKVKNHRSGAKEHEGAACQHRSGSKVMKGQLATSKRIKKSMKGQLANIEADQKEYERTASCY